MPLDPELPENPSSVDEAVATDALGSQATDTSAHHRPIHTHCENCNEALQGPYCYRCGQHDFDINRSFGHTFLEALENFFHFDTKLFQNLITLLFRPGRMTAAFNAGKRAAQVPPFRLYVFVSILFFFITFLGKDQAGTAFNTAQNEGASAISEQSINAQEAWNQAIKEVADDPEAMRVIESLKAATSSIGQDAQAEEETVAEEFQPAPANGERTDFERALENKVKILNTPEGQQQMLHSFLGTIPKLILICLPLFALYTRVLFRKSGRVYLQHLVMALHFHTFIYLWLLTSEGWAFLVAMPSETLSGFVTLFCNLWLIAYPFLMLKHMFANSWMLTITKTVALSFAYLMTLIVTFAITAVLLIMAL